MNVQLRKLALLSLSLSALLASNQAVALYKWVDESGNTQYSDRPPPPSAKTEPLGPPRVSSGIANKPTNPVYGSDQRNSATPAPSATGNNSAIAEPASTANRPKTAAELDADFKKRRAEQEKQAQKLQRQEQEEQQRQANCERARNNLATLESGRRMRVADANGESVVMDDGMRQNEVARLQSILQDNKCN